MPYLWSIQCRCPVLEFFSTTFPRNLDRRLSIDGAPSAVHPHTLFQDSPSLLKKFETLLKMSSPLVVESIIWQKKTFSLKSSPLMYRANTMSCAQAATSVDSSSWIEVFHKGSSFNSAITCCLTSSDISTIHWWTASFERGIDATFFSASHPPTQRILSLQQGTIEFSAMLWGFFLVQFSVIPFRMHAIRLHFIDWNASNDQGVLALIHLCLKKAVLLLLRSGWQLCRWRLRKEGFMHSMDKTLLHITYCGNSQPFLSVAVDPYWM